MAAYTLGQRMRRQPKHLDEAAIVRKIERAASNMRKVATGAGIVLGIGDDAALWKPRPGFETVLTTDWFLEGTHFWRDWHPAQAIGWKGLMRAASDIAAMGAEPRCFLLSLALPATLASNWLDQFLRGMGRASKKLNCPLAGGDTTRAGKILIHVTVVGEVPRGAALLRSGARPGDSIYISGRLGEAELGLKLARSARRRRKTLRGELLKKHLFPEARIRLGCWLREEAKASAAMDLSDGLSLDLHRLCAASGVGAEIHAERLPTASSKFANDFKNSERFEAALHGGDDYELLFCIPEEYCDRIPAARDGLSLTRIGEVTKTPQISLITKTGASKKLLPGGWDPFR